MKNDVIIIGGGASGLCAAVAIKQKNPSLTVRLLEALPRVGKKLALTGNGRCNITNRNITIGRYHGTYPEFCEYALSRFNIEVCEEFFLNIGVPFVFEGDKAYPASLQAASVVDCLRFAAEELGVTVMTDTKVTNIQLSGGLYKVIADKLSFLADNIIIAAGLMSGGDRLGCDSGMLKLLAKAGFDTVETRPAIVQLKTAPDIVKQLKGIKVNAEVSLKSDGKILRKEYGETLFCDYGLSGPPILQVSGAAARLNNKCTVSLDLMPEKSFDTLCAELENRVKNLKTRTSDEFFTGMMNKRLGQVVLKMCGLKLGVKVSAFDKSAVCKIASVIKSMSFEITGNTGFVNSQVTSGGLDTAQFDSKTMMCIANRGLYAVGEILDIDGDCGGFNLQWAWSSALCAAHNIAEKRNKNASDK